MAKKADPRNRELTTFDRVQARIQATEAVYRRPRFNGQSGLMGSPGTFIPVDEFLGECQKVYEWLVGETGTNRDNAR